MKRWHWIEVVGWITTPLATLYFLWTNDFGWRAFVMAAAILVFGAMSGDVIARIWR